MNTDTAFKSVRAYYFRDACAKSWGLVTNQAKLSDLRAVWKAAHLLASEWSKRTARELAKDDRHYVAREGRDGRWFVWDCVSDHRVEFN